MIKQNLCFDWRFHYLDRSGPRFMSPVVSNWRVVDLPHVEKYEMPSADFAKAWDGTPIDLLLIDGDHRYVAAEPAGQLAGDGEARAAWGPAPLRRIRGKKGSEPGQALTPDSNDSLRSGLSRIRKFR